MIERMISGMRRRVQLVVRNVIAPSKMIGSPLRRWLYLRGGVAIGSDTRIQPDLYLANEFVTIGARCFINAGCHFDAGYAHITIGDDVNVAMGVILAAASHEIGGSERRAVGTTSSPIHIGSGVWLGARVTVLPGVAVADGCVIAAGAVVTRDTHPDGLYAGVPARRVRDLMA